MPAVKPALPPRLDDEAPEWVAWLAALLGAALLLVQAEEDE